jgi:alkylation response protein AidB-like acyl-CoA dehydrogenase
MDFRLTPEQQALEQTARRLAEDRFRGTEDGTGPSRQEYADQLARAGFAGITLPVEDGGQGGSLMDAILVMQAVARVSPTAGDVVQATNFGAIRQLAAFGGEGIKADVLPKLLSGGSRISGGMSETEAGSALTGLATRAGFDGNEVVINGHKLWGSPHSDYVVVWARFGPRTRDIGCVLVPADAPGFSRGKTETFMSGDEHAALYLDDCRVPRDNVLVESDALRRMFTVFGVERIGNAARALALAWAAFDRAVEHAKVRTQFGRPLCEFQGLQWKFADMKMKLDAAQLLIYRAAQNADDGLPDPAEATIAKCFANETAFEVANQALQVFGAAGYSTQNPLEYYVRRTRGWMIAGGSVEMMRNRIAEHVFDRRFSQWAPREGRP